jgi:hypothetical protein
MGSPQYYTDHTSATSGEVKFNLKWVSQAAGALPASGFPGTPTTGWKQSGGGQVTNVVHGATGVFTVTLKDAWVDSLDIHGYCTQAAAFSAAGVCDVQVTTDNSAVAGTQTVVILCTNAAGAAVEPAVNDQIVLSFRLQSYNAN